MAIYLAHSRGGQREGAWESKRAYYLIFPAINLKDGYVVVTIDLVTRWVTDLAFQLSRHSQAHPCVPSSTKLTLCRPALNELFIYRRQNSQIQSMPSGTDAYSSGNGASYHVSISCSPNLIVRIRSVLFVIDPSLLCGVRGTLPRPLSEGVPGRGVEGPDSSRRRR